MYLAIIHNVLYLQPGMDTLCLTYNERPFCLCKENDKNGGEICNYMGEVCTYSMFKERHNYYNKVVVKVTFLNLNIRRNTGQSMLLRRITLSVV